MDGNDRDEPLFEMDDDISMADLIGEQSANDGKHGRVPAQPLPTCSVEIDDDVSMEDLLSTAENSPQTDDEEVEEETDSFPNEIFEGALSLEMDDLFCGANDMENLEGVICEIHLDGADVELQTGVHGRVGKEEFGDWARVAKGDSVRVGIPHSDTPSAPWILLDHQPQETSPKKKPRNLSSANFRPGTRFVIDGSNVCRSYMESRGSFLAPLLTLVCTILDHGGDVICVFDGNERYVLDKNAKEPDSGFAYDTLLMEQSRRFIEAPSSGPADDYLLKIADRERLAVISNDNFDKAEDRHRHQYPWLVPGGSRLLKGRVDFLTVTVPKLGLEAELDTNIDSLLARLRTLTQGDS